MLRRRPKPPEAGPIERAARRRRRNLAILLSSLVVGLLLFTALFLMVWLRESPPIDSRWVRVPDAVAIVRVNWKGEGASLIRAPLQSALATKRAGSLDFGTIWATMNFVVHPDITVWVLDGAGDGREPLLAREQRSGGPLHWMAALSLRRRQAFIESRVRRLLGDVGISLPASGEGSRDNPARARPEAPAGRVQGTAVVVGTARERLDDALERLVLAGKTPHVGPPSPESLDESWAHMPLDAPFAMVIRDPETWSRPILEKALGGIAKDRSVLFSELSSNLFQGAPWMAVDGQVASPDAVEITFRWLPARDEAMRDCQQKAVDLLIRDITETFAKAQQARIVGLPPWPRSTESVGFRVRIEPWSALFVTLSR